MNLPSIAANLEQTPEQIWRSKSPSPVSYPDWGNDACFQVEDVSFWFRHRNACILEAMKQYPPPGPVFDIGGGNGFVAKGMQDAGFDVVLVEPGAAGSRNAKQRGIKNVVCAGLQDAGFVPTSIAAAGLFDVIEHIADDRKFLEIIATYLWRSGRVYITVPAYPSLWSGEDVDAGHFRRYSRQALRNVLKEAGFAVEFLTGFFQFLPPAILAARVLPYRLGVTKAAVRKLVVTRPVAATPVAAEPSTTNPGDPHVNGNLRAQHEVRSSLLSRPLSWLQRRELDQIRSRRQASFGGSWLVVATKI